MLPMPSATHHDAAHQAQRAGDLVAGQFERRGDEAVVHKISGCGGGA